MRHEPLRLRDNIRIQVWDASTPLLEEAARRGLGRLRAEYTGHNMVPITGRTLIARLLGSTFNASGVHSPTHFAFGVNATATADANSALGSEVFRDNLTEVTEASSEVIFKYFLSTTLLNGQTLREVGLFNAASVGTLFARYVLNPVIVKDITTAITFHWDVTFALTP